jgi:hypothetical protein
MPLDLDPLRPYINDSLTLTDVTSHWFVDAPAPVLREILHSFEKDWAEMRPNG